MPKVSASDVKSTHRVDRYPERINNAINAKRKHQHRPKLQVASRRKAVKEAASRSSQGSLFEASRNVEIGGGEFNSAQGHHANFTINFNQSAMDDSVDEDGVASPGDTQSAQLNPLMDNERGSTSIWDLRPLPVQRSCDIYYRHLAVKGRGSPLWLPEPSSTLPNLYRRQGIAVGDVGIITASGGFDFMFNVCLPADHPINQQGLPEGFSPLFPQLQSSDIRRHTEFNPNSHLSSASVEKNHRESNSSGIEFTSSASEGAILTMPQGAHAEDLANVSRFRQYLSANAESWYRYVNNVRGREARNGDVRLVVGCDKASSWGMATFANSTAQDFHLKFKPTGESGSTRTYGWEYSGMIEARAGPDLEETDELRSSDDSGHSGLYRNQCLFVRTLNATLRDDVWQGLGFDFETAMEIQYDSYPNSYIPSSGSGPSTRSPSPTDLTPSNSSTMRGSTRSRSSSTTSSSQEPLPSVCIADFNTALTAHPAKVINDFMLIVNPHARIAITEDKDWMSLIVESDQRLPPPEELINRMLVTHDVCEADGVVFLQLKQENQPTNHSRTNIRSEQVHHDIDMQLTIVFETGFLEPPQHPLGQTSVGSSQPYPSQTFGTNTSPYISASCLPSPLSLPWILSSPTECPGSSIQTDPPSLDPWDSSLFVVDFDTRRILDTPVPEHPPFGQFVPGKLLGSWAGSLLTNSSGSRDPEAPSRLLAPVELDFRAHLPICLPTFSGILGLEWCVPTLNLIHTNINDIKVHKEQCRALSKRCSDLLAVLKDDSIMRSACDSISQEEIDGVITRLDRKVKEYGSWNHMRTLLQQDEIRSELSFLQTAMENVIAKISIRNHLRYVHSVNLPNYPAPGSFGILYEPHQSRRRKRMTRASLRTLEEAFVLNPKPTAVLRKQLAQTLDIPERSVQVWFQNHRARQKRRYLSDSELVTSTTRGMNGGGPLPRLGASDPTPVKDGLELLSDGLRLARGTRYADLRIDDFLTTVSSEKLIQPKLTDFGPSTKMSFESSSSRSTGSPAWLAPEIILGTRPMLPPQLDVWNIGALLSSLIPTCPWIPGPKQNDSQRRNVPDEFMSFQTHQVTPHVDVDESLRRTPHTMDSTGKSILADDNLTHNLEDLNDGTSMLMGSGISEGLKSVSDEK